MRKLLLTTVMIIASALVSAQGFMFFTMDQVLEELGNSEYTMEISDDTSKVMWVALNDSNFEWILFFDNENEFVYHSKLISKNYEAIKYVLEQLANGNNGIVKTGDGHWVRFLSSGVVDLKAEMTDYSDYPVIMYQYLRY